MNAADTPSPTPRGPWAKWILGSAIAAFVGTRLAMLFALTPILTDVHLYFTYAVNGVDLGLTPYKDIRIEYPPAAYWAMAAPRMLAADRLTREQLAGSEVRPEARAAFASYHRAFRWQMCLAEAGAFVLWLLLAARRWPGRTAWAAWGYLLATTPLAHLLFDRLDAGMLLLLMAFAYAWSRGGEATKWAGSWTRIACMALGLSVAYKLVSLVAVPFVLLALWRNSSRQAAIGSTAALCAAMALPFLVHWPSAGDESLAFLKYHAERGIEIESVYASGLMLLRPLGVDVQAVDAYGGTELQGELTSAATTASTWILLLVLAGLGAWALALALARGARYDRDSGLRFGIAAIVATVVLAKVLSPQYLIFALPLWLVGALDGCRPRRFLGLTVVAAVVACLTTWLVPYHWFAELRVAGRAILNDVYLVPDMKWQAVAVLAVRNGLLAGGALWLGVGLTRGAQDRR